MNKSKLTFRFHNPNTAEGTADYILHLLLEANQRKLEHVLQDSETTLNETIQKDWEP